jgi:hypothetical protein
MDLRGGGIQPPRMGQAKNKKQRECPAKGGIITPEECGRGRNSSIACPADCVHNPFNPAHFESQYAPLESRLIEHLTRKLATDLSPSQLREIADAAGKEDEFTANALHFRHLLGEGRLAKWKEAGFGREWKNDEKILLSHFETLRPALVECRGPVDDFCIEAVDLFSPERPPFRLFDAATAATVGRYDVMLGWRHTLPAGERASGGMIGMPTTGTREPLADFKSLLEHLGAPADDFMPWLVEHMPLVAEAFAAVDAARREKQLALSDLTRFTLTHPVAEADHESLISLLGQHPRLFRESPQPGETFVRAMLLDESCDRERDEDAVAVGELHLYPDRLVTMALGEAHAAQVRSFIASLTIPLGPEEGVSDDLSRLLPKTTYDPDLVPPSFLEEVDKLEMPTRVALKDPSQDPSALMRATYRGFADQPLPALDGMTPRAAAADPAWRDRLLRLMKGHVSLCDVQRRTRGVDIDLNPLLGELGLDDLILPPPPLGEVDEEDFDDMDIPLDPPPKQDLLEGGELESRLDRVIGDEALWNRLEIRLADVLDAFNDLPDKLNPHELAILQSTVLTALGALHPDQPPGYEPDPERMLARYESWMKSGDDQESVGDFLDRIFAETRQPELCEAAADLLIHLEKESGKKLRPKKLDVLFTAIAAAVWEAAHWPPVLE